MLPLYHDELCSCKVTLFSRGSDLLPDGWTGPSPRVSPGQQPGPAVYRGSVLGRAPSQHSGETDLDRPGSQSVPQTLSLPQVTTDSLNKKGFFSSLHFEDLRGLNKNKK